jgi:hypothetical protein
MPSCAGCGKTITERETGNNVMGSLMGGLRGNAEYMPNHMIRTSSIIQHFFCITTRLESYAEIRPLKT